MCAPKSPTTVLPAPVGAATSTAAAPASTASSASTWKASGVKGRAAAHRARSDASERACSLKAA